MLIKAAEIYFMCAHRQPLWLFERHDNLIDDFCEELLLVLLSLAMQYAPSEFENDLLSAKAYNEAAQGMVMLKIANGTIGFRSLQALCLLAFSNLVGTSVWSHEELCTA